MSTTGIWAIVPAAGAGNRMGSSAPKQYLPLQGKTVLAVTLERLASFPAIKGVFVGLSKDDTQWPHVADSLKDLPVEISGYIGGAERANTVVNGLKALSEIAEDGDWVLVHDAARPCVRHEDIQKLIDEVTDTDDGGILALPITDTVKLTREDGRIDKTIDRTGLWRALTPQLFPLADLARALDRALLEEATITDEASAMEHIGAMPRCVEGHPDNIKITYPADLELAELYLSQQTKEMKS
ncbi:MAG: 2-C-methyl-D-erythritol 4-phosphate cytidylyltransferase [Acidiferrobacterales bacterium]|nr:2-C-methyl-D-erythritol 4-phosphate cytidylyltransferase [Acidiferrobacterales bacterium]